ncbi:protein L-Myc-1b [Lepisosteus oculatus]|uniref:protein L-Myc-1b n=1 Tax=Lepisosteus oculatus TaxID=7918 RepID=UPI0035F50D05
MPGIHSNAQRYDSCEMEYDRYQHYFYDDHDLKEDFYKSTAPSEDIWKKFELVPTPPMSPSRSADAGAAPTAGDTLEWVSQFLGQDEEQEGHYKIGAPEIVGNLSSIIIQDCMWSGFSASQRLEKVVNERLSGSAPAKMGHTGHPAAGSGRAQPAHQDASVPSSSPADCVDPAAVLTYPYNPACKKQAYSGSESRTDSEDEEIDVVTVESKQSRQLASGRKPVTITVRADPHDPCMKRFHISIHQQQHNYAAPSPDSPPPKRPRQEPPPEEPACPPQDSPGGPSSSPPSSDAEDTDKRKTHNYLERKRRNDLRSRFLALRDEIPGLVDCPKTPKVVILTKAAEYLRLLHSSDKHKAQERRQLKSRQQQLLRRLADLKRS